MFIEKFESLNCESHEDSVPEESVTRKTICNMAEEIREKVSPLFKSSSLESDRSWDSMDSPAPPEEKPGRASGSSFYTGEMIWVDG